MAGVAGEGRSRTQLSFIVDERRRSSVQQEDKKREPALDDLSSVHTAT